MTEPTSIRPDKGVNSIYLLPGALMNGGKITRFERGDEERNGFENGREFGESMAR